MLECINYMKFVKSGICTFLFSLLMFLGCSNASQNQNFVIDDDNLKMTVLNRTQTLQWTQELEKNRLSQKINSEEQTKSDLKLGPLMMIAQEGGISSNPVYPVIDGFASLDISDIDPGAINIIDRFCIAYKKGDACDSFMSENSIYSLALFLFDSKEEEFSTAGMDWVIGKAFVTENSIEIPVRMFNKTKFIDVNFFMKQDKESYKILDLEISNTGDVKKALGEASDGKQ